MKRLKKIQPLMIIVLILNLLLSCSNDDAFADDPNNGSEEVLKAVAAVIYYELNGDKHAIVYTEGGDKKTFINGKKVAQIKELAPDPVELPENIQDPDHHEIIVGASWTDEEAIKHTSADGSNNTEQGPIPGAYYVTVDGSASNSGTSEAEAWSIEYAFANAKAGDVVYIKAGNYGNKNLSVTNAGTSGNPIKFIGYDETPGDVVANNRSTYTYGTALKSDYLPTLTGNAVNEEGQGVAIKMYKDHVEIHNIQITTFEKGILSSGDYNVLNNVILTKIGDFNPAHSYPTATSNSMLNYKGIGIAVGGDYSEVHNSIVVNAGAEAYRVDGGAHQVHSNNQSFADNNVNPTDYYYLVTGGAHNNRISDTYIERVGNLEHRGHGLVLKVDAYENEFYNNTIKNTNVEMSFSGVKNNYMENIQIIGGEGNRGFFLIANGANGNEFVGCSVENANGVAFTDWNDGYDHPYDLTDAGFNNTFKDCVFKNGRVGIDFGSWQQTDGKAHDNNFINCRFENLQTMFKVDRLNENNKFTDCHVEGVENYMSSSNGHQLNAVYVSGNTFVNNGFSAPN